MRIANLSRSRSFKITEGSFTFSRGWKMKRRPRVRSVSTGAVVRGLGRARWRSSASGRSGCRSFCGIGCIGSRAAEERRQYDSLLAQGFHTAYPGRPCGAGWEVDDVAYGAAETATCDLFRVDWLLAWGGSIGVVEFQVVKDFASKSLNQILPSSVIILLPFFSSLFYRKSGIGRQVLCSSN